MAKDLKELGKIILNFNDKRNWKKYQTPKDLVIGVSTEAGELLDHFRFKTNEECEKILNNLKRKDEIAEEASDVLWFLLLFAERNNIDLEEALLKKLEKNEKRFPLEKYNGYWEKPSRE